MAKEKSVHLKNFRTVTGAKKWLRTYLKKQRKELSTRDHQRHSQKICRELMSLPVFRKANVVAAYLSFGSEVQTDAIVKAAWKNGKTVVIPTTSNGQPYFSDYDPSDRLIRRSFGPYELHAKRPPFPPRKIDLVLVPGLGFDQQGFRLGFGGGIYDRLLPQTKKAFHVGLFYSCQGLHRLPKERHDHPLDAVVTETGFHRFRRLAEGTH